MATYLPRKVNLNTFYILPRYFIYTYLDLQLDILNLFFHHFLLFLFALGLKN